MPDALTQLSSLTSDQTAFVQLAYYALRDEVVWDAVCDVRPSDTGPEVGATVTFTRYDDLAAATTPLTETDDISTVALSDGQVSVTLAEYGNAIKTTAQARHFSFLNVMDDAASIVGYNAGDSMDIVARTVAIGGSYVFYGGDATQRSALGDAGTSDNAVGKDLSKAVAYLRGRKVRPHPMARAMGADYVGFLHPDVAYDVRNDTATTGWVTPAAYAGEWNLITNAVMGKFGGAVWVESTRCLKVLDSGHDAYVSAVFGAQALAKAYSNREGYGQQPIFVMRPPIDTLMRFTSFGWKHLAGYGIFRTEAIQRFETTSSLGT